MLCWDEKVLNVADEPCAEPLESQTGIEAFTDERRYRSRQKGEAKSNYKLKTDKRRALRHTRASTGGHSFYAEGDLQAKALPQSGSTRGHAQAAIVAT